MGYGPWDHKESGTTERLTLPFHSFTLSVSLLRFFILSVLYFIVHSDQ